MKVFLLKNFKLQKQLLLLFLSLSIFIKSQETTIKGNITNQENRGIQSASVSILDENGEFLGYSFTDHYGNYSISFDNSKVKIINIKISCLGYHKITKVISSSIQIQNFTLEEKIESIKEVVLE